MRYNGQCDGKHLAGLSRLAASFRCAFIGWGQAWRTQPNLRIHFLFVLVITGLGIYLGLSAGHWAILALTYTIVMVTEMLNTSLEVLTDLVSPEYHPLAGRVKDVAAGAVLAAAIGAVVVGIFVLGPPLLVRLGWL